MKKDKLIHILKDSPEYASMLEHNLDSPVECVEMKSDTGAYCYEWSIYPERNPVFGEDRDV